MRRLIALSALFGSGVLVASSANATISVVMDGWDYIPMVVVSVGNNQDCGTNQVRFSGPMTRGQSAGTYPEAGNSGVDVCWRRTADPLNPNSGLQPFWTRCSSDGTCVIS
jgi:hypothetical protein